MDSLREIGLGQGMDSLPTPTHMPIVGIVPQKCLSISKAACYGDVFVANRVDSTANTLQGRIT